MSSTKDSNGAQRKRTKKREPGLNITHNRSMFGHKTSSGYPPSWEKPGVREERVRHAGREKKKEQHKKNGGGGNGRLNRLNNTNVRRRDFFLRNRKRRGETTKRTMSPQKEEEAKGPQGHQDEAGKRSGPLKFTVPLDETRWMGTASKTPRLGGRGRERITPLRKLLVRGKKKENLNTIYFYCPTPSGSTFRKHLFFLGSTRES